MGARAVEPDDDVMNDLGYESFRSPCGACAGAGDRVRPAPHEEQAYDLVTVDDVVRLVRQMSGSKG